MEGMRRDKRSLQSYREERGKVRLEREPEERGKSCRGSGEGRGSREQRRKGHLRQRVAFT